MRCKYCKFYLKNKTLACACGVFCNKECMDNYHSEHNRQHKDTYQQQEVVK